MKKWIGFILLVFIAISAGAQEFVKVALAQIQCISSDTSGNIQRIEYALQDAVQKGAQIVCFPETSLYGWVNPEAHKMASTIPGKDADILCSLAKKFGIYICVGLCEKEGDNMYDSVILVDSDGEILLKHRKNNILTELMDPPYTKGSGVQAVDTEFGRIGLMICADSFVPELVEQMKDLNPDMILIPYGWAASVDQWPQHGESLKNTITHVAKTAHCPVVGTDCIGAISHGPWTGMVYGGQSYAIDKDGKVLAKGRDRERDILLVNLNKK